MTDSSQQSDRISILTWQKIRRQSSDNGTIRWTFGHLTRCDRISALLVPPLFLGSTVVAALAFGAANLFTLIWGLLAVTTSAFIIPWAVGGDLLRVIELPSRMYWSEFRPFGLIVMRGKRLYADIETLEIDWNLGMKPPKYVLSIHAGRRQHLFSFISDDLARMRRVERRLKRDFRTTARLVENS